LSHLNTSGTIFRILGRKGYG